MNNGHKNSCNGGWDGYTMWCCKLTYRNGNLRISKTPLNFNCCYCSNHCQSYCVKWMIHYIQTKCPQTPHFHIRNDYEHDVILYNIHICCRNCKDLLSLSINSCSNCSSVMLWTTHTHITSFNLALCPFPLQGVFLGTKNFLQNLVTLPAFPPEEPGSKFRDISGLICLIFPELWFCFENANHYAAGGLLPQGRFLNFSSY